MSIFALNTLITQLEDENQTLRDQNIELIADLANANASLQISTNTSAMLFKKIDELQARINNTEQKMLESTDIYISSMNEARKEILNTKKESNGVRQTNARLRKTNDGLRKHIYVLRKQLYEERSKDHYYTIATLQDELDELRSKAQESLMKKDIDIQSLTESIQAARQILMSVVAKN